MLRPQSLPYPPALRVILPTHIRIYLCAPATAKAFVRRQCGQQQSFGDHVAVLAIFMPCIGADEVHAKEARDKILGVQEELRLVNCASFDDLACNRTYVRIQFRDWSAIRQTTRKKGTCQKVELVARWRNDVNLTVHLLDGVGDSGQSLVEFREPDARAFNRII